LPEIGEVSQAAPLGHRVFDRATGPRDEHHRLRRRSRLRSICPRADWKCVRATVHYYNDGSEAERFVDGWTPPIRSGDAGELQAKMRKFSLTCFDKRDH
jgi:hypothetical protein